MNLRNKIIKLFWKTIGEDQIVLKECSNSTRRLFGFMGVTLILIVIITGISISYGTYELLESYNIGLIVGIYFSFLILVLYLFILYTLTKNVLPHKEASKMGIASSYIVRVGFLMMLGVIVSQPIEYYLFSDQISDLLNKEINKEIIARNSKLNKEYVYKIKELETLNYSKEKLAISIAGFKRGKDEKLKNFIHNQYKKNFFVRKMILMDSSPNTSYIWLFSLFFVTIFMIPVIIKTRINFGTDYYNTKRRIQISIIDENQKLFVSSYNKILGSKYAEASLEWSTIYKDPPFNTIKIKREQRGSDKEFSNWLLNEGN